MWVREFSEYITKMNGSVDIFTKMPRCSFPVYDSSGPSDFSSKAFARCSDFIVNYYPEREVVIPAPLCHHCAYLSGGLLVMPGLPGL